LGLICLFPAFPQHACATHTWVIFLTYQIGTCTEKEHWNAENYVCFSFHF